MVRFVGVDSKADTEGFSEWSQLRKRQKKMPHIDFSRPLDPTQPPPLPPNYATLTQSPEDQWKVLEERIIESEMQANAAADAAAKESSNAWDWAEDHIQKSQQRRAESQAESPVKHIEVELEVNEDKVLQKVKKQAAEIMQPRAVPEKQKKSKSQRRRRDYDEDDDFDPDEYYAERERRKARKAEKERQKMAQREAQPTPILLPEYISVANLAEALGIRTDEFISQLMELGFEDVTRDSILTGETAALVAQEYGFEPTVESGEDEDLKPRPPPEDPSSLPLRPPVVTIMGHVDHGKTTLLDYLRKSSIVEQEHGGITQHIGAFSVSLSSGKQITFLDTPGHAAFLSMRQRGANVTDIVILVVAADDSVMPQTLEAIKHARNANVPIIVAINKIDKPEANVNRVKADLAAHGVEIEDFGGDVQVVCVSGKTGQGMEDLEENILLLSEMLDIRAEHDGPAEGWVLESTIKPIGRVATVLIKRGTLRKGDYIVAGLTHCKVRQLRNENGVEVDEAPPGTAVEVLGWKDPPTAGDMVLQAPDEQRAKACVRYREELKERAENAAQQEKMEQERRKREAEEQAAAEQAGKEGAAAAAEGQESKEAEPMLKHLNFIIKGDVHGSVEACTAALLEQGNNEIRPRVLSAAPGQITESDVEHAEVSDAIIVNFNNEIPTKIKRMAHDAGVKILDHNIIYHLVEDVKDRLADALPPLVVKKVVAEADVLQIFQINIRARIYKNIAGCRITNGVVKRGGKARVIRDGEVVYEGKLLPEFSSCSKYWV